MNRYGIRKTCNQGHTWPGFKSSHVAPNGRDHEEVKSENIAQANREEAPAPDDKILLRTETVRAISSTVRTFFVHMSEAHKGPLTCENVPEVGLEPDFSPCNYWELQKHSQSEAVRHRYEPVRREKCAHCTQPFF
jgi:hypothetical protein